MKVETNSPTRESIQRTNRKMLSADDWAFQWNIDPNTARSMAYRGIPKVKNSESVNTTSSQCPLRTCIPPGKIEKKGVVMVAVPKKKKMSPETEVSPIRFGEAWGVYSVDFSNSYLFVSAGLSPYPLSEP